MEGRWPALGSEKSGRGCQSKSIRQDPVSPTHGAVPGEALRHMNLLLGQPVQESKAQPSPGLVQKGRKQKQQVGQVTTSLFFLILFTCKNKSEEFLFLQGISHYVPFNVHLPLPLIKSTPMYSYFILTK